MPLFVLTAQDGPDGASRRNANRDAHVAYIGALHEQGKIVIAGPILDENAKASVGAVIVFEAASLDEAKAIMHADPYVKGGVYAVMTVAPFRQVFPKTVA